MIAPILMGTMSQENEVLESICEYLAYRGYFFWRNNNMPVFDKGKMIFRRMPKWSIKGVADILLVHQGQLHAIEVKDKSPQSKDQKQFEHDLVNRGGAKYYVVRSIEDIQKAGF